MKKLLLRDGAVARWPAGLGSLKKVAKPNFLVAARYGLPQTVTGKDDATYSLVAVLENRPAYNADTHKLVPNLLPTVDSNGDWTLDFTSVPMTADEIKDVAVKVADSQFTQARQAAKPAKYDDFDIEVLTLLRHEVVNFDLTGTPTPLCDRGALGIGVGATAFRNAIRNRGNNYNEKLVDAWAARRVAKD